MVLKFKGMDLSMRSKRALFTEVIRDIFEAVQIGFVLLQKYLGPLCRTLASNFFTNLFEASSLEPIALAHRRMKGIISMSSFLSVQKLTCLINFHSQNRDKDIQSKKPSKLMGRGEDIFLDKKDTRRKYIYF